MKIVLLAAGGRAGADFFHSLLDGHSQILQFPGYLRIDKKFKCLFDLNERKEIPQKFIKSHPEFFDSKLNKFERWNKLGQNKVSSFKVDKKKFIKNFIKIAKNGDSKLDILKKLHFAYFLTRNRKINDLKVLLIHTHLLSWTKEFIKIFSLKNFDIIHTIRHPLASLNSQQKSWLNFCNGRYYFPEGLYYHMDTVINCINNLSKLGKVSIVQLERLHIKNNEVMKNFCKKFKIKHEKIMTKSTKNNLKWWGDAVSGRFLSGVNKKHEIFISNKYFYKRDLIFFQNITKKIMNKYNYKFYVKKKEIYFNLFPMKCEILVWKNSIKNIFFKGFRWKHFLSIPFFYLKRILIINLLAVKVRKIILPKSL